jgi:type III secretion protein J
MKHATTLYRVAALALFVFSLVGCGNQVELQRDLSDQDANEIIALLLERHIVAQKQAQKEGFSISLDEADLSEALSLMHANGLPRRPYQSMGDIFKKDSMISTPLEERARYLYALSQELERTFEEIDGVVAARVHIVLPDRVAPGEPLTPSSAAVLIKYQQECDPDILLPRIRAFVAASIPGLANAGKEKISVVFIPAAEVMEKQRWRKVGPFQVAEKSAGLLQGVLLGVALLSLGALAMAVLWRYAKLDQWYARLLARSPKES